MAKFLHTSIATVILSAALAVGGVSFAAAHHGDPAEHSTTKGKNLSDVEMKERQITAELNRKQLMPQIAALETPVQTPAILQPPMTEQQPGIDQQPMPSETPAATPSEEENAAEPTP